MKDEISRSLFHPRLLLYHLALAAFLVVQLSASSCARRTPEDTARDAQEITVAAASNLTDAFTELGKEFTAKTGIRVVYSFGATADLAKQIEHGAPFDVFASADVEHVEELKRKGLIVPETAIIYARGHLVVWTPTGSRITINRIEDLTRADVERIAIAKPDVAPYGRATVEALRKLNLWQAVESKVIYGQNVSQVKQYAATGNADVAFIPLPLVKTGEGLFLEIDEQLHQPIDQMIAALRNSSKEAQARSFVAYVISADGQALLKRYGYRQP